MGRAQMRADDRAVSRRCWTAGCQNKMYDENKALYDQNHELQRDRTTHRAAAGAAAAAAGRSCQAPHHPPCASAAAPIAELPTQLPQPRPSRSSDRRPGNHVNPSRQHHRPSSQRRLLRFRAGHAQAVRQGSLDKVVAALKKQITPASRSRRRATPTTTRSGLQVGSNQELSVARADAVKQYLVAARRQTRIASPPRASATPSPRGTDRVEEPPRGDRGHRLDSAE